MSLTKVTYAMIEGAAVNVLDFGADPTGVTDSRNAIQAAHDSIVASGVPGVLVFGNGGTYRINSGITINAGFVSVQGNRAVLDFSNVGNIACVTITGGNGFDIGGTPFPWNQADFSFSGLKLIGPGSAAATGLYLNENVVGSTLGPSHLVFRDLNICDFEYGARFADRSYLNQFDHCDFRGCKIGMFFAKITLTGSPIVDSGSTYTLVGGTFYKNEYCIWQEQGTADVHCFGVTIGETTLGAAGIGVVLEDGAQVSMFGCHFETDGTAIRISSNSTALLEGCRYTMYDPAQTKFVDNHGYLIITGGLAGGAGANTGTSLFFSDGYAKVTGLRVIGTSPSIFDLDGGSYTQYDLLFNSEFGNGSLVQPFVGGAGTILGSEFDVTLTTLNVWVNTGLGLRMGMYMVRDTTSGGTALFMADTNIVTAVQNGITGLEMRWDGTAQSFQFRVTSGTVPRLLEFGYIKFVS
jgi:hypothetical protein